MNLFTLSTLSLALLSASAFAQYEIRMPTGSISVSSPSEPTGPTPTPPSFTQAQAEAAWTSWVSSTGNGNFDWANISINTNSASVTNNPDLNAIYSSFAYLPNEQWPSTTLSGYISFTNNNLTDLSFMKGVTSIGSNLYLNDNSLTQVDGLDSLVTVGSHFHIHNNSLTNVDGLMSLESTDGNLWLQNNNLTNLDGLSNLTSVGRSLRIYDNPNLSDISGLKNLAETDPLSINGDDGVYIASSQTFTVKAPFGSPFCDAVLLGAVKMYKDFVLISDNPTTQALVCQ